MPTSRRTRAAVLTAVIAAACGLVLTACHPSSTSHSTTHSHSRSHSRHH